MNITDLLSSDGYLVVNKKLMHTLGLEVTLFLAEICNEYGYWKKRGELEDGYFYSTVQNVEANTTLTDYQQRKAINKLKELGIIDIKVKGVPPRRFVKINLEVLESQFSKNFNFNSQKTSELILKKLQPNNNNINNNNLINKNNNINKFILLQKNWEDTFSAKQIKYLNHVIDIASEYEFSDKVMDLVIKFFEDKAQCKQYAGDNYLYGQFNALAKLSDSQKVEQLTKSIQNGYKAMSYVDDSKSNPDNISSSQFTATKMNGAKF